MEQLYDKAFLWTDPKNVEPEALQQIKNISELPFVFHHVAVMPDCHYGKGATVGTVIATKGAIIPAAVGVDIGCGMIAVCTTLKRSEVTDEAKLRHSIERAVPMSAGRNNVNITETAKTRIAVLEANGGADIGNQFDKDWRLALGTLGGGNHFIELCTDEEDTVWVTLHSGSRGVGNKIGNYYIKVAQALMDEFFIKLSDRDLSYFPNTQDYFQKYLRDLIWAQEFARLNRDEMMDRVMEQLSWHIAGDKEHAKALEATRINCHHNFTQVENHFNENVWVTRKGAIQAKKDQWAMIPGSMGTRSYIVQGLENPLSFHSAPHGAGRRMSRNKARETFTKEDLQKAMEGIEYRDSDNLIDEIPGAYKDIDHVIEEASDLVTIKHTLKQFINMKGD